MSKTTGTGFDTEVRLREYARSLGLSDERAVAAALHRHDTRVLRGSGRALDEACALLRSWWHHPSHRASAA